MERNVPLENIQECLTVVAVGLLLVSGILYNRACRRSLSLALLLQALAISMLFKGMNICIYKNLPAPILLHHALAFQSEFRTTI